MQKTIPQLKHLISRLIIAMLASVICISIWSIFVQYRDAVTFAERQAGDYALALAEHSETAFAEADRIMRDTLHDLKLEGGMNRLTPRALFEILQREAEGTPQVGTLFITDKNGNMLANSNIFPQNPINLADREYFQHYLTTPGADFTISSPVLSRQVGRWRFNLIRPLTGSANSFTGLIAVGFEVGYFNRFVGPASMGSRYKLLLIRNDGAPLTHEPYETNIYKANFSQTTLFKSKLPASPAGTYHGSISNDDGTARIISYHSLQRFPVIAVVAISKRDVLTPWAWKTLYQLFITFGLCAVILVLTRMAFRQMDSLQTARSQVGELEEELLHLHKVEALGRLAGNISHDFNNLLTPILVYAEMVRRGLPEDHRQLRRVDGIITSAQKARDLNRKLMTFSRKQDFCAELLDLNEVIESFRNVMRSTLRENIAINFTFAPEAARIRVDRNQLEQLFLELSTNAQDAIEAAGTISVTTGHAIIDDEYVKQHPGAEPGSYMLIEFKDNGRGMDAEMQRHVYEPFYSTKSTGQGGGLGLATVYGIVKRHGGYVKIDSHPGEGTSVLIYLPLRTEEDIATINSTARDVISSNDSIAATILLVEDELMVRKMAADLLESEGFSVLEADSPSKAIEIEQNFNGTIDLLLTDVIMPEMSGVELYKKLQHGRPSMPVLYISGYASEADIRNGNLEITVNFLKKPFAVEPFIKMVRQVLSSK